MNLNQQKEDTYRRQCRKVFIGVVSMVDRLFKGEMKYAENAIVTKWKLEQYASWCSQIPVDLLRFHIDKYCEPEYYGLMHITVREYKLRKRIENESN